MNLRRRGFVTIDINFYASEAFEEGFVFRVPKGICNQQELFSAFAVGLNAPGRYFGYNWDAFNDCLAMLDWIDSYNVFILHDELPRLSEKELGIYLDILNGASLEWKSTKIHQLNEIYPDMVRHEISIYFPIDLEHDIKNILKREPLSD